MAAVIVGLVVLALIVYWQWPKSRPITELLRDAKVAVASGDYATADELCQSVLEVEPNNLTALLLAGESATKLGKLESALEYYLKAAQAESGDSIMATFYAAEVARGLGRVSQAEELYRIYLNTKPNHRVTQERMAYLLDLQGRRWESEPYLYEQIRSDNISYSLLIRLGTRNSAVSFPDELKKWRLAEPTSAAGYLAEATQSASKASPRKAEELLRKAILRNPDLVEAHARLGRLLSDHDLDRLPDWHWELPSAADSHPDIWMVRGLWANHVGQKPAAIRCFWEAGKRDPNQRIAHYQLGQLLSEPEFAMASAKFSKRAELLQELAASMTRVTLNPSEVSSLNTTSNVLEQLGRYWEAYGWCGLILVNDPAQISVRERMRRLHQRLNPELPLTDPAANPATEFDFSTYPLPEWPVSTRQSVPNRSESLNNLGFRFEDRTSEMGIHFTYFNSDDPSTEGTRMYEFSGGGVGVLDYDLDGFPDLYFTQGCAWPPNHESTTHRDRLFRNLGTGRFQDVTEQAGLGDGWFSQGVAVGDYDSDGWPDLYLANIGRNRLYHNQGDGTFLDVSEEAGITGTEWTTSCLIADLNGNGHPDLYDVNYLKGDDLFDRLCLIEGRLRTCVPGVFFAERDHILLNSGNGLFPRVKGMESAMLDPARAGLGIVAADIEGSGRLNLFVANDVVANAYLVNESPMKTHSLALRENALLSGLAFDRDGRAQACMGVAADDVDGNGLLDFFVTNYYEESNALYLQTAPGLFTESARTAGLYEPSYRQLGFGTQFLDGNLDGWVDLVVANGHLDDFQYINIPFRMPPQFFVNRGQGKFQELEAKLVGPYFAKKLLGRSLAVLDWNRDGRPDFVVSHLETPVAVLTNESDPVGNWLKVRLVGVHSNRDAIGARVRIEGKSRSWVRHLTAGGGYQASNERALLFGLGEEESITRLTVQWPSGRKQMFENIRPNQELIFIENQPLYFVQKRAD